MSYSLFQALTLIVFAFAALMVMVRFAFYRRKDRTLGSVYFWGGLLFFTMALNDLASNWVYGTELHQWQTLLFLALTALSLYKAIRQRQLMSSVNNA